MKWLGDLWDRFPYLVQWAISLTLLAGVCLWVLGQFWPDAKVALGGDFELSAWERTQIQEDRRHAGQTPDAIYSREGSFVYVYESGCILGKHKYGKRTVRTWIPHPSEYPPPPEHEEIYGGLTISTAGLSGGGCVPEDRCWYPVWEHPGITESQPVGERQVNECWVDVIFEIPNDGCQFARPYNACIHEWSAPEHWHWTCCRRAHR